MFYNYGFPYFFITSILYFSDMSLNKFNRVKFLNYNCQFIGISIKFEKTSFEETIEKWKRRRVICSYKTI